MRLSTWIVAGGILLLALPAAVWAESSSVSYKLWANSFSSGGAYSTSANYRSQGSVGDFSSVSTSSSNYRMDVGFEAVTEEPRLTLSISGSTFVLGSLVTTAVSSGSRDIIVATNADFGYTLTVTETSEFSNQYGHPLTDVSDGAVTAGSEECGIALTGTDRAYTDDRSVSSTPRIIASRTDWTTGTATTVIFKGAISPATPAGTYTGTVTFVATGNF